MATKPSKARRKRGPYKAEALKKATTLGLRISQADKDLLENAARELGVPLSEFVLTAAKERAQAVVHK